MARVLRPVGHEERLSVVDHLDELRGRMFVCGAALLVAFGLCFWQNGLLLNLLNKPLPPSAKTAPNHLGGLTNDSVRAAQDIAASASLFHQLSMSPNVPLQESALIAAAANKLSDAAKALPQSNPKNVPITIGVGEPFTTTLTVCFYFPLLLTLPVLLYAAYAFVIPALTTNESRVAIP